MFTVDQIPQLIDSMSLDEKCSLLSGSTPWLTEPIERLDIPALMMTDGPHGLRKESGTWSSAGMAESDPATCFPTAVTLASTWDRGLMHEVGVALAQEAVAQGVGVVLGPGINLKRSPLCGRNFEYFSEDPHLTGELATALVEGVQSRGVGTSLKHFAVNNQETDRLRVDAQVDERTLRETYLAAFETVVTRAQPATVMCAYNRVNGEYASQHHELLTEILRDEWGFEGLVVSDWGAVDDRVVGVRAGLDLEMPTSRGLNDRRVAAAVRAGELDEEAVDRCVARVLRLVAERVPVAEVGGTFDVDAHHELAATVAARGAVLLANDGVLPLPSLDDVVLVGELARTPRFQGAGSSQVNPTKVTSLHDALLTRDPRLRFAPGYPLAGSPVEDADVGVLRAEALELAEGKTAVVCVGLPAADESEGYDRTHLEIPASHRDLVVALTTVARKVVVVLANGAAVQVTPWADDAHALLELWLGGQAGGEAAARLLLGEASPSGRLAETIPAFLEQHPAQLHFPGERGVVRYGEGIFIGYKGLDRMRQTPSYAFGHGLSYTSFEYTDLEVVLHPADGLGLGDVVLEARCTVTNTGERDGVEVPQLYVGRPASSIAMPVRELKGFERVELAPGESATVAFAVTRRQLSTWNPRIHGWELEPGAIRVEVGASSADLRLVHEGEIEVTPARPPLTKWSTLLEWREHPEAWERLRAYKPELAEKIDRVAAGDPSATSLFMLGVPAIKLAMLYPDAMEADALEELLG